MFYYEKSQHLVPDVPLPKPTWKRRLKKGECAVMMKSSIDYSNDLAIEFMQLTYVEAHVSAWQAIGYAKPVDNRKLIVCSPLGVSIYFGEIDHRITGDRITHDPTSLRWKRHVINTEHRLQDGVVHDGNDRCHTLTPSADNRSVADNQCYAFDPTDFINPPDPKQDITSKVHEIVNKIDQYYKEDNGSGKEKE